MKYFFCILPAVTLFFSCQQNSSPDPVRKEAAPPFFTVREHPSGYADFHSEDLDPNVLTAIRIGYFGPSDPNHPAVEMWQAAVMAIEQANQIGGYQNLPFHLLPIWSDDPWGTGVSRLFREVYNKQLIAIIGGVNGPTTHLAEQVVAKAHLPLISPACSDKTINLANVPWMFSCLPGDHLTAPPLATVIAERCAQKNLILISAIDHDSHRFTVELLKFLTERNISPQHHIEFESSAVNINNLTQKVLRINPQALVVIADAVASARIIAAVSEHVRPIPIFGGPTLGQTKFLDEADQTAEGVIFPVYYLPGQTSPSFDAAFQVRWQTAPGYRAAYTYDAVNLLVNAIRKAGLNRARIGKTLRGLSGYQGITGPIRWDPLGSNTKSVSLGTIKNGSIIPLAPGRPMP